MSSAATQPAPLPHGAVMQFAGSWVPSLRPLPSGSDQFDNDDSNAWLAGWVDRGAEEGSGGRPIQAALWGTRFDGRPHG